ncbi:MAG: CBS domain-containing protein [Myxococcaceae bacterium]|nr:CBS domain-containing protein [Myxococcaceae bacterium]MCI0673849.1 CBS domain-containing protein [Myxococcaceae bacterium]
MKRVGELMTRDVVTLKETDSLARVDLLLSRARIRHLPVVRGRRLVGLLTHRDLLRAMASVCQGEREVWVMDVMVRDVATVQPETPVREALHQMVSNRYGCLPVLDGSGELMGILTDSDLLRYCDELLWEKDLQEAPGEYR